MRVGLVIVSYDAAGFIGRAIEAVAAQTRRPERVLLVDNASRDDTVAVARQAASGCGLPIEVVASRTNLGFAGANNRAVEHLAGCDLIALLNPDAFPEPGWLSALVSAAETQPAAASFASRQMLDGAPGCLDGAGDVCHVSGLVWRRGHGQPLGRVAGALHSGPVFSACGAAALYRRDDWQQAGGFDERFFCYAEDVDLGFRLQLAGRGCWYVADAVVHHLGSATAGVGSAFAVYHGHRNMEWMLMKNMPSTILWRYLPLRLATWIVGLMRFVARGRGGAYLHAKWDALRGLPAAWRARAAIQATRRLTAREVLARLDRSSLLGRLRTPGG